MVRGQRPSQRGFTIIEAMVALLIVAFVAGVVLFEVMRGGWRGMNAAGAENRALAIARNELARAGVEWPLKDGSRAGVVDLQFRYIVEARPRPEPGGRAPLTYDVSVVVQWTDSAPKGTRIVRLETIKLAGAGP